MKILSVKIAFSFAMLNLCPMLLAQSVPAIPSFDQVMGITLFSHNGWQASFSPDGSGGLIYGSAPTDMSIAPKQTFSFQEIYNLLIPHLSGSSTDEKSIAVFISVKGRPPGTPNCALYLDDKSTIKKIMAEARAKSVPLNPTSFKELLLKYPPEWDDTK
jgi:hypothetical protein